MVWIIMIILFVGRHSSKDTICATDATFRSFHQSMHLTLALLRCNGADHRNGHRNCDAGLVLSVARVPRRQVLSNSSVDPRLPYLVIV
jgi:hypothetical protein